MEENISDKYKQKTRQTDWQTKRQTGRWKKPLWQHKDNSELHALKNIISNIFKNA